MKKLLVLLVMILSLSLAFASVSFGEDAKKPKEEATKVVKKTEVKKPEAMVGTDSKGDALPKKIKKGSKTDPEPDNR